VAQSNTQTLSQRSLSKKSTNQMEGGKESALDLFLLWLGDHWAFEGDTCYKVLTRATVEFLRLLGK
jgi:hypothetical protein